MRIYDTRRERKEERWLRRHFGDVINPNGLLGVNWQAEARRQAMLECGWGVVEMMYRRDDG